MISFFTVNLLINIIQYSRLHSLSLYLIFDVWGDVFFTENPFCWLRWRKRWLCHSLWMHSDSWITVFNTVHEKPVSLIWRPKTKLKGYEMMVMCGPDINSWSFIQIRVVFWDCYYLLFIIFRNHDRGSFAGETGICFIDS